MVRLFRVSMLCAAALAAQACGRGAGKDAAGTAQAVLTAAQAGDAAAFEAGIDRPALRADLRQQLMRLAAANGLDVGGPSDAALDRMIGPQAFRLAQAGTLAPLAQPPSPAQVAAQLKSLGKSRACLHDLTPQQACVLTFARGPQGWRLVGMPAEHLTIELAPEPARKG